MVRSRGKHGRRAPARGWALVLLLAAAALARAEPLVEGVKTRVEVSAGAPVALIEAELRGTTVGDGEAPWLRLLPVCLQRLPVR